MIPKGDIEEGGIGVRDTQDNINDVAGNCSEVVSSTFDTFSSSTLFSKAGGLEHYHVNGTSDM